MASTIGRSGISLDFAKQFVARAILNQIINYLGHDPARNMRRFLGLLEKLAIQSHHKTMIRGIIARYESDPVLQRRVVECAKNPKWLQKILFNWVVNATLLGIPRQQQLSKKLGVHVPYFILVDPTSACNLACTGCWAGKYNKHDTLPFERLDRLFSEAKELGIYWIVMSGGEPFAYPRLFELLERHQDMAFMIYTNGTLIDDKRADKLMELGTVSPCISVEGWETTTDNRRGFGTFKKIEAAWARLKERGIIFGASITITRNNIYEVFSDEFIDYLIDRGVVYVWTFHYIPVGKDTDISLMITPEQRAWLKDRVNHLRTTKPIFIADFWNDGDYTGGCIAGGRIYFHINARGDVEPCAFAHFAVDNILNKSLVEVLGTPIFREYQARQPFYRDYLAPCPIIDNPQALRDIVRLSGAKPTHEGAETVLEGAIADFLDQRSADWKAKIVEIRAGSKAKEEKEYRATGTNGAD